MQERERDRKPVKGIGKIKGERDTEEGGGGVGNSLKRGVKRERGLEQESSSADLRKRKVIENGMNVGPLGK